jgi:acetyltransferase-like isoleucine patch superfamily enzyme
MSRKWKNRLFSIRCGVNVPQDAVIGDPCRIRAETAVLNTHLRIGRHVRIQCKRLEIGRGVSIGNHTVIQGVGTVRIADHVTIGSHVFIDGFSSASLEIGPLSWIGRQSILNCSANLRIGRGTCVGIGSKIFTHGCWFESAEGYPLNYRDVTIGNNVWLALETIVQPGAVIEDDVFVHAGSVVNGRLASGFMYRGIPAKRHQPLSRIRKRMTPRDKMEVIARTLSTRLIQAGWKGEAVETLRFKHPYPFQKSGRKLSLVFLNGRNHEGFQPETDSVVFAAAADREWIRRAAEGPSRLIVDVSAKRGCGDQDLESLVLNLLQDSVFRFYADDEK